MRPLFFVLVPSLSFSLACAGILGGETTDTGGGGGGAANCDWFRDQDGDGFGDPDKHKAGCTQPSGYVEDDTDCDDADPGVHPGGTEVCDDVDADEDCDGMADEDDDSLVPTTWYADTDNDGYGDPQATQAACDQPSGYVDNSDDCDDSDRKINPDGQEVCDGNGGDEDCDGLVDSDDDTMDDTILPTWYKDNDGDKYGDPSGATKKQCDAPSGYAANKDDCDDTDKNVNPGESEVCGNGQDDNCDGSGNGCGLTGDIDLSTADVRITGPTGGSLGYGLAGVGDIDNDGYDDIVLGAPSYGNDGHAYAFYGGISGAQSYSAADVDFTGETSGNYFGAAITGGDYNADGKADVVIGDPYYTYSSSYSNGGRAYLFTASLSSSEAASSANTIFTNNYGTNDELGYSLSHGDWSGDNRDDLFMGAAESFVYGDFGTISSSSGKDVTGINEFEGTSSYSYGQVVSGGDMDGDGSDDLVVSNPGSGKGHVYVYTGERSGSLNLDSIYDADVTGVTTGDELGSGLDIAGDVDGDGYADLVAGARNGKGAATGSGAAYVCLGPVSSSLTASSCEATLKGETGGDLFGFAVAYIGDENGDGNDDVVIGAPGADGKVSAAGVVYLFDGPLSGSVLATAAGATLLGASANGSLGAYVDGAGDFNGDGTPDILVGGYSVKNGDGAAYVVFGGGL